MKIAATDSSPLTPNADESKWLEQLASKIRTEDILIRLDSPQANRNEVEPIIYRAWDGTWWTGRYIGIIHFEGSTLCVRPRFGFQVIREWLTEISSVYLIESAGKFEDDEFFIAEVLAILWAREFQKAAKHSLPSTRLKTTHVGTTVRGRLDLRSTLELRQQRKHEIASVSSERTLENAASQSIVAAHATLRRRLGNDFRWLNQFTKERLLQLVAGTGANPRLPSKHDLRAVRYTPLTAPYKSFAELSWQIASEQGLFASNQSASNSSGVLLDVAELWEIFVLNAFKDCFKDFDVMHGTLRMPSDGKWLLKSDIDNARSMGFLIPDIVMYEKNTNVVAGIIDAKYKSIRPSPARPFGPQRDDLYQMTAYLNRYGSRPICGILVYPNDGLDSMDSLTVSAELFSPWSLQDGNKIAFMTLPLSPAAAVAKLRDQLDFTGSDFAFYCERRTNLN